MDSQLFELAALFQNECRYVVSVEQMPTKARFNLKGDYIFDLFFRAKTGNYSYTLIKADQRVVGWNNAPHHEELSTHPHHFHQENGTVTTSDLASEAASDIVVVARTINAILEERGVTG